MRRCSAHAVDGADVGAVEDLYFDDAPPWRVRSASLPAPAGSSQTAECSSASSPSRGSTAPGRSCASRTVALRTGIAPPTLIGFAGDHTQAPYVVLAYPPIRKAESNLGQPLITKQAADVHPAAGVAAGVAAMLAAVTLVGAHRGAGSPVFALDRASPGWSSCTCCRSWAEPAQDDGSAVPRERGRSSSLRRRPLSVVPRRPIDAPGAPPAGPGLPSVPGFHGGAHRGGSCGSVRVPVWGEPCGYRRERVGAFSPPRRAPRFTVPQTARGEA